jgi:hypothetical protein
MRILPVLLCALLAGNAMGDNWRAELTPPKPGPYPPPQQLHATYRFGWGALAAANADFDFSRTKRGELRLVVDAKTVGPVRALWRMNARHEAVCRPATLQPVSLDQTETYQSKTKFTHARFDESGVSYLRESKPADKTPPRTKRFQCPDLFDLHSALLFIRSQRLLPGDEYCFVVYPASSAYLVRVRAIGREKLKVAGSEYDSVKLDLRLQEIKKDLTLGPHRKFKKATVWVSEDRNRLPLKVAAEVFVGSVWAELQKAEFP